MTGLLAESSPEGRGFIGADRSARSDVEGGGSAIATTAWQPNAHQARVLAVERGFAFAVGGLGSGKSEAAALKLLMWALAHPRRRDGRPTQWYVVAPEFGLIRTECFEKILEHARRLRELGYGAVVKRVVKGMEPKIVLMAGQTILGRSADVPDRMRGYEIDGAWGDEAQRWEWKAFRMLCSRMRSAAAVRLAISASPEDSPGWLWKALEGKHAKFNRIREELRTSGSGMWCTRWTSADNKANEAGVLGVIGAVLDASPETSETQETTEGPSVLQAQELGGRFPGTPEAPALGVVDYGRAFAGELVLEGDRAKPEVLGVDVGETKDFTWLTVLSLRGVGLHQERWNVSSPGVPGPTFYVYLEDRIAELAVSSGVRKVVVDVAKAGKPVAQNLDRRRREGRLGRVEAVIGVDTGAGRRKHDAIESLGVAMAGGDVTFPSAWRDTAGKTRTIECLPWLRKEFEVLVAKDVGQGKRIFDHPLGGHDDGIVANALAWSELAGKTRVARDYSQWKQPTFRRTFGGH